MHGSFKALGLTENGVLEEAETQTQEAEAEKQKTLLADSLNEAFADAEELKPFFMYLAKKFQDGKTPSVERLQEKLEKEGIEMEVAGAIAESINSLGLKAATELMLKIFPEVVKTESKSLALVGTTTKKTDNVTELKPKNQDAEEGRAKKIGESLEPRYKDIAEAELPKNSLQFRPGPLKEEIDRVVDEEENPYQAVLRLTGRR